MFFTEGLRLVCCFSILGLCVIIWLDVWVWLILRLAEVFVTEYSEGLCHIPQHQQVNLAVVIVPINIQTEVFFALPIDQYFVVLSENCQEVLCVLFSDIFYA